jgi:hypothetical protein
MATKRYSTYEEIERDLEILKLEKEIHYQKLVCSVQKTKESFTPQNVMTDMIGSFSSSVSNPYFAVLSTAIPFILKKGIPFIKNWISKRKGGE